MWPGWCQRSIPTCHLQLCPQTHVGLVEFGFCTVQGWVLTNKIAIIYLCIKTSWILHMKLKLYYILSSGQTGHLNMPCQIPREFQWSIPERRRKLGWSQALWPSLNSSVRWDHSSWDAYYKFKASSVYLLSSRPTPSYIGGPCLRKAKVKQLERATNKTKTIFGRKKVRFLVLINYS